jgi:hypothetical protein
VHAVYRFALAPLFDNSQSVPASRRPLREVRTRVVAESELFAWNLEGRAAAGGLTPHARRGSGRVGDAPVPPDLLMSKNVRRGVATIRSIPPVCSKPGCWSALGVTETVTHAARQRATGRHSPP